MHRDRTTRALVAAALALSVIGALACGAQAKETVEMTYYYLPG